MKDIHDANLSFFSPQVMLLSTIQKTEVHLTSHQPFFIAGFFFPQQLFQLAWLYRLWKLSPKSPAERAELEQMVDYVPYYAVGNLCIGSVFSSTSDDHLFEI